MSLSSFHHKFILVLAILIGVAFATPVKVHAADYSVNNNGLWTTVSGTTPFTFGISSSQNYNLNIDDIWQGFGTLDYASFDANISLGFNIADISNYLNFAASGNVNCDIYAQYNDASGAAQTTLISNSSLGINLSTENTSQVINFTIPVVLSGTPTGFKVVLSSSGTAFQVRNLEGTSNVPVNFKIFYNFNGSITNFSTDPQASGGQANNSPIIKNSTPLGYSTLNLGVNGDLYFCRTGGNSSPSYFSSLIIPNQYLQPISFYFSDVKSHLRQDVRTLLLTLGMGDYVVPAVGDNPARGSPIAIVGDTRPGDYCVTLGFSSTEPLSDSTLTHLSRKSEWAFEFNLGWTGNQFPLPDNTSVSYCYFQDTLSGNYYCNVYFFFTTEQLFDSFLIRSGPFIQAANNAYISIEEFGFTFSKFTGTINDQLNKMEEQWSANIPGHDSFTSANNQASSAVGTAASLESSAMADFDSAYGNAGLNYFSLDGVASQMTITSSLITRIYNILPAALKYIIIAVLSIGVMAVIVRAGSYVGGKNGD